MLERAAAGGGHGGAVLAGAALRVRRAAEPTGGAKVLGQP